MLTITHTTEVSLSAEDFFDFLKQNNAFEAYKCNIINNYKRHNYDPISSFNEFFNDLYKVQCWIAGAFRWYSTAQGFEYWKKLDDEWCKHFEDCDKINLIPISAKDLKKYFREPVTGKWYKVTNNSYNRSADNDPNCVWDISSYSSRKDLVGKECLILEEPCCVIMDLPYIQTFKAEMVKVWVPEYNCAQWVLFKPENVCKNTK